MAVTISGTLQKVQNADVNAQGKPGWDNSANGIKTILLDTIELAQDRGVMIVADLIALSLITGVDARWVVVESEGALYRFNYGSPQGVVGSTQVVSARGGFWRRIVGEGSSYKVNVPVSINAQGQPNLITTVNVVHNLNTIYPEVCVYEVAANAVNGVPATLVTDYVYTSNSDSGGDIVFNTPNTNEKIIILKAIKNY